MTTDQKINLLIAIGTWVSGLGTFCAVIVSLVLAKRSNRIDLKVVANIEMVIPGNGQPAHRLVQIHAVNRGDRVVTITSVGWKIGERKKARHCVVLVSSPWTDDYPKVIGHGESAAFQISLFNHATPDWFVAFVREFIKDLSPKNLGSLRAWVHTSLGQTIEVKPGSALMDAIKSAGTQPTTSNKKNNPAKVH